MRIHKGDIVRHFKRETLTLEQLEDNINLYLYRVLDFARHTETGELLVIYEALYSGCDVCCGDKFARPFDMFMGKVDHEKYPNIKSNYRFEIMTYADIGNDVHKIEEAKIRRSE